MNIDRHAARGAAIVFAAIGVSLIAAYYFLSAWVVGFLLAVAPLRTISNDLPGSDPFTAVIRRLAA